MSCARATAPFALSADPGAAPNAGPPLELPLEQPPKPPLRHRPGGSALSLHMCEDPAEGVFPRLAFSRESTPDGDSEAGSTQATPHGTSAGAPRGAFSPVIYMGLAALRRRAIDNCC